MHINRKSLFGHGIAAFLAFALNASNPHPNKKQPQRALHKNDGLQRKFRSAKACSVPEQKRRSRKARNVQRHKARA